MRYTALIDGDPGAYGVVIPDMPGCTAMGDTIDEALANAIDAMRDWAETMEEDGKAVPPARPPEEVRRDPDVARALKRNSTLASVPLIRESGRPAKANLSIDTGILAAIDAQAKRQGLTRSALIELMAKRELADLP